MGSARPASPGPGSPSPAATPRPRSHRRPAASAAAPPSAGRIPDAARRSSGTKGKRHVRITRPGPGRGDGEAGPGGGGSAPSRPQPQPLPPPLTPPKGGERDGPLRRAVRLKNAAVTHVARRWLPCLGRAMDRFHAAPYRVKAAVVVLSLAVKVALTLLVVPVLFRCLFLPEPRGGRGGPSRAELRRGRSPAATTAGGGGGGGGGPPLRILYIAAQSERFAAGTGTGTGTDRFRDGLLPALRDGVESMTAPPYGYDVDVHLVLGYGLDRDDEAALAGQLPRGVGSEVGGGGSAATAGPLLGRVGSVLRDGIDAYDLFVVAHDGARIRGDHVAYYSSMSDEIATTDAAVPALPGFLHVEIGAAGAGKAGPVEPGHKVDLRFPDPSDPATLVERAVDPSVCCRPAGGGTLQPGAELLLPDLAVSPDSIGPFSLTEPSDLDWVWRQEATFPQLQGDAGGADPMSLSWMARSDQLLGLHRMGCDIIFPEHERAIAAEGREVHPCRIHRLVSLHPDNFSKHLVLKGATNGGATSGSTSQRLVKANDFLGHLNSLARQKAQMKAG